MYIGYLKLRTFVDAIHVVVNENYPNVLPHVKIRDNPNVSREEWQWLQSMDTLGVRQIFSWINWLVCSFHSLHH